MCGWIIYLFLWIEYTKLVENTSTEIPMKFNMTWPTYNISNVSSNVYSSDPNRAPHKDVHKPRSITTCNLTHKVAKSSHVKVDIRKPSNNQSSPLSLSAETLRNNHHLPRYVNHLLVLPSCLNWKSENQHTIMIVVLILIMYQ